MHLLVKNDAIFSVFQCCMPSGSTGTVGLSVACLYCRLMQPATHSVQIHRNYGYALETKTCFINTRPLRMEQSEPYVGCGVVDRKTVKEEAQMVMKVLARKCVTFVVSPTVLKPLAPQSS